MMVGTRRVGMMVVAGSLLLPLGACSRTSDGTIVMDKPVALPSFDLMPAKPLVPSWMRRKQPEVKQASAAPNFPPPPREGGSETQGPPARRHDGVGRSGLQERQRRRPRPHGLRVAHGFVTDRRQPLVPDAWAGFGEADGL